MRQPSTRCEWCTGPADSPLDFMHLNDQGPRLRVCMACQEKHIAVKRLSTRPNKMLDRIMNTAATPDLIRVDGQAYKLNEYGQYEPTDEWHPLWAIDESRD